MECLIRVDALQGTSLMVQSWGPFNVGLICGCGAKIRHALEAKNQRIKQKQICNQFNKVLKYGFYIKKIFKKTGHICRILRDTPNQGECWKHICIFCSQLELYSSHRYKLNSLLQLYSEHHSKPSLWTFSFFPKQDLKHTLKLSTLLILHPAMYKQGFMWQFLASCINIYVCPFTGRQLIGCCAESACFLLNSQA